MQKNQTNSITNERQRSFWQKYVFDPFDYQSYFDVDEKDMIKNLIDAFWPFIPENQHHLVKIDSESVREFKIKKQELYGPLWIVATLIIEFVILGHLQKAFTQTPTGTMNTEELLVKQANYSIHKIFTVSFLMLFIFILNPFVAYLVFKNKGALEINYISLLQTYGYSFAIYVPLAIINCLLAPLNRLRVFLIIVASAISIYYIYKETKEQLDKYFDSQSLHYFLMYMIGSSGLFSILFRYYFLSV